MSVTNKNRLSITHPELCREWDYEKNGDLRPEDVSYGSGRKVWWKCKNGHGWEAQIGHRSESGKTGCPYCSGHRVSDKNRLSIRCPNLLKEWDYDKNKDVDLTSIPVCSTKIIWWKCKKGHSYSAVVYSRTKAHTGCSICINQKVDKSNCIATTHPYLIKEWHPTKNRKLTPYNLVIGSEKTIWWICDKGHEYVARPSYKKDNDRRRDGKTHHRGECPYCNGVKVCRETSLVFINPSLAKEWHPTKNGGLTAQDVFPSANKSVWWRCKKCKCEWEATINNRNNGNGCPDCNRIVLNDGVSLDSYPEAYVYLKLKANGFKIELHKKYGFGRSACDFYLPEINTYIETTSFCKSSSGFAGPNWKIYYRKIMKKKRYTEQILGARFRFIQIRMPRHRKLYVRKNMKFPLTSSDILL